MTARPTSRPNQTDIAIVGGGLAGLALASHLLAEGHDVHLFEARQRFGGRIHSVRKGGAGFDLGPSWIWPGQPRVDALIRRLELARFVQHSDGDQLYEAEPGSIQRGRGIASMAGAWRVVGGLSALIQRLVDTLPSDRLHAASQVMAIGPSEIRFADGSPCSAQHIVLAMPPRLVARLDINPSLTPSETEALQSVPTWMAGHAKLVAVYDTPFWREDGLSGDAFSRVGPLAEMHDASAATGQPAALFGFVGVPPEARQKAGTDLSKAAIAQLARLFGPLATAPTAVHLTDWALDPFTAVPADQTPLGHHPAYGMPPALSSLPHRGLHLCVTEVAPDNGGLIEGALAAAEATAHSIGHLMASPRRPVA